MYLHAKHLTSEGKYAQAAQRFCYALFLDFSLFSLDDLATDTAKIRTELDSSSNAFVALLDLMAQDAFLEQSWSDLIRRISSPSSYGEVSDDDRTWVVTALARVFAGRLCARVASQTMNPAFNSRALEVYVSWSMPHNMH